MMDLTKRSWKRPGGPELTEDLLSLGHVSGRRLSLLDVGAGDGLAMEYLAEQHPDWSITGIDPEPGDGPEGSIQKGYAENLPAEDNSFDLVLMECSLSKCKDPDKALREVRRVLKPGGRLLLSDMYSNLSEEELHGLDLPDGTGGLMGRLETSERIWSRITEAGFLVLQMEDCSGKLGDWVAQTIMDGEDIGACLGMSLRDLKRAKCGYFLSCAVISPLWDTLSYAGLKSPFYRRRIPENISLMKEFRRLPFSTPEDIRKNPEEFLCVPPKDVARIITLGTSGSTGGPKRLFFTEKDLLRTADFFEIGIQYLVKPGWRMTVYMEGPGRVSVGGLLKEGLFRIHSEVRVHGLIRDVDAAAEDGADADAFVGVPGQMHVLAMAHPELRPKSVLLSADYVPESVKSFLEETWHCRVFTHWGMTETGYGGGVQCGAREGYHLRTGDLFIEVINPDTGENVPLGSWGELVLTTFHREAMPLIRYRTGDIGRLLPGKCGCGSLIPRLDKVQGRLQNVIRPSRGGILTVHLLDEILLGMEEVQDYSAVWEENTQCLILTIKPPADHNCSKENVEKMVHDKLGDTFDIRVEIGEVSLYIGSGKRKIQRI